MAASSGPSKGETKIEIQSMAAEPPGSHRQTALQVFLKSM